MTLERAFIFQDCCSSGIEEDEEGSGNGGVGGGSTEQIVHPVQIAKLYGGHHKELLGLKKNNGGPRVVLEYSVQTQKHEM